MASVGDKVAWDPIAAAGMGPGSTILADSVRDGVPVGTVLEVLENGDVRVQFSDEHADNDRVFEAVDTDPEDGVLLLTAQEVITIYKGGD